jgi:hypothetical protein
MRQSGPDLPVSPNWAMTSSEEDDRRFNFDGMDFQGPQFPRFSTSFVEFCQWAFGPDGIRSLRLLVHGDFSYDGRFAHSALLLCRRDVPQDKENDDRFLRFRPVRPREDGALMELYKREMRVLQACPTGDLFD